MLIAFESAHALTLVANTLVAYDFLLLKARSELISTYQSPQHAGRAFSCTPG